MIFMRIQNLGRSIIFTVLVSYTIFSITKRFGTCWDYAQPTIKCSKLLTEILEQGVKRRSGIFIVNFEHVSHLVVVFLLSSLSR